MMNYGNPISNYQRNLQLAQQQLLQSQMRANPQFSPYPQPQQPQFYTQPVGSIDEAKAYPVDPGMSYIFPDTGTGKIYLKMLNTATGRSDLFTYKLDESTAQEAEADPIQQINTRLASIEKTVGVLYESISGHPGNAKPDGGNAAATAPADAATQPAAL